MILVSHKRAQLPTLEVELTAVEVEFESPRAGSFIDTKAGRFALGLLRVACNPHDYVAHRLILGARPHVGPGICNAIAEGVVQNHLNFRDLFYSPLPDGVFQGRQLSTLGHARTVCTTVSTWQPGDTLEKVAAHISGIIKNVFGSEEEQGWHSQVAGLPQRITLEELRDFFWAATDEQQTSILKTVYDRLRIPEPAAGLLPPKVRIMTMHGAKGLSAGIVFTPGLEERMLPGDKRRPYPGLVFEAARMLYVSITRARVACIFSYCNQRYLYGNLVHQTPTRFAKHLGGPFTDRSVGLSNLEVCQIMQSRGNL